MTEKNKFSLVQLYKLLLPVHLYMSSVLALL